MIYFELGPKCEELGKLFQIEFVQVLLMPKKKVSCVLPLRMSQLTYNPFFALHADANTFELLCWVATIR
jgi:hypothetical protein